MEFSWHIFQCFTLFTFLFFNPNVGLRSRLRSDTSVLLDSSLFLLDLGKLPSRMVRSYFDIFDFENGILASGPKMEQIHLRNFQTLI